MILIVIKQKNRYNNIPYYNINERVWEVPKNAKFKIDFSLFRNTLLTRYIILF